MAATRTDISVSCGPDALVGGQIKRPVLPAEVLSTTTESYDRGLRWQHYQDGLPSPRTFLLVAQDRVSVEVYRRGEEGWLYSSHTRLEEVLELSDPPCRLTIAKIYRGLSHRLGSGGV
jgi:Uma2 family endonuclease